MRGFDYKYQVLVVISLGTFMVVLDTTIVNIALPKITAVFSATTDQSEIVLTGYLLALATIMPTTSFLTQRFGLKRCYIGTLIGFTVGSALCGISQSLGMLSVARVIQGFGGGLIQPLGMATVFAVTPPGERGKMIGLYSLSVMVAPVLGPTLGGYLVEFVDWRWVFYVNVPPGIAAIVLGMALLRESPIRKGGPFDLVGFVLAAVCSSSALLAASDAPKANYAGWSDPWVLTLLAVAAITLPIFIWWELRTPNPLLEIRLFKFRGFSIATVVVMIVTSALYGGLFLLPVFLQSPGLRGLGAWEAGLLLFPQAIGMTPATLMAGRLYDKIGPRPLMVVGLAILGAATWQMVHLDLDTPDSTIRWLLIVRGAGLGLAMIPASTAWLASVPGERTQAASTFSNVMRNLFGAFATAIFQTILTSREKFHFAGLAMFSQWSSPEVSRMLAQAQQAALAHGGSLAAAKASVVLQLYGRVQQAATVQGFDDCFFIAAMACFAAILPTLLISKGGSGARAEPVEA
jgi:EmrB/QacA subfamily drug resistance transporter